MGSRGRLLFDLNEPPVEDNEDSDGLVFQPQKAQPPSNSHASDLFPASGGSQRLLNNHAFSHASSVSGFQPFVRSKLGSNPEIGEEQKKISDQDSKTTPSSKLSNVETAAPALVSGFRDTQSVEREEGEWSDAEGSGDINGGSILHKQLKTSQEKGLLSPSRDFSENNLCNLKISDSTLDKSNNHVPSTSDQEPNDRKSNSILNTEGNAKLDTSTDTVQEETGLLPKQREVKGIEASHALKCANNPGKRKIDQHLEAKLGKKRNRQTMFLNLEDVKLAGPMKTSTPRRQTFPPPITTRIVKEVHNNTTQANERIGEKQTNKDQKQGDVSSHEGSISMESGESKLDSNGDMSSGLLARPNRPNNDGDIPAEASLPPIPRQGSWKIPTDSRLQRNMQASNRKPVISNQSSDHKQINKKHLPSKKQNSVSTYQDSSVERLIREVTNEKFWHHPGTIIILFVISKGVSISSKVISLCSCVERFPSNSRLVGLL